MRSPKLILSAFSIAILLVVIGVSLISVSASRTETSSCILVGVYKGPIPSGSSMAEPQDEVCQFLPIIQQIKPRRNTSLTTSLLRPNWMLASFEKPDIPRYSTDGGLTWKPVQTTPWTTHPYGDQIVGFVHKGDFSFPPRFIVLVDSEPYQVQNGLYRTGDLGASWTNTTFQILGHPAPCNTPDVFFTDLYVMPANPMNVYLSGYCYYETGGFPPASTQVYFARESSDGGVNWFTPSSKLSNFTVSPPEPSRVYANAESGWVQSNNAGDTWNPVNFGFSLEILTIGADNILYAITKIDQGVDWQYNGKRSEDGGTSWNSWNIPTECNSLRNIRDSIAHPTIPGLLLMRCTNETTSKIVRSFDKGNTWHEIVAPAGALLMLDEGNKGRLLGVSDCANNSASQCFGLWASDDGGSSWRRLTLNYDE